ncbi:ABC transporter permease [Rhizobium leguminosarum]|uniref:ABC transporter permease n=1 Tax=Rhizobium leguminosarum TaxID=384 RepID=UPI001C95659C|nr:ABC transporter permease [Rhizobium leguminosarum]MBY5361910.1 ABC transporter permease [Rhizobium leguminosarum]MBY5664940.1 ABC transporter permease [Rhizobium leguminosarum]MBY5677576.1 ABC transporter permease [Rhizobium leguminosarum]
MPIRSEGEYPSPAIDQPGGPKRRAYVFRRRNFLIRDNFSISIAVAWCVLAVILAIVGPLVAPYDYRQIDLADRLVAPADMATILNSMPRNVHILGTDELGRDVMSRLLYSISASIGIAVFASAMSTAIGITLGIASARFGRLVDQIISLLVDVQATLPFMILSLGVLTLTGNRPWLFAVLLGFYGWERVARLTRGLALAESGRPYVAALRNFGASNFRIYWRHVLGNISGPLLVSITLILPEVLLLEATLSFLGLGVQPPATSLGNMIGYGREYLQEAPWITLTPSAFIVFTTIAVSIVGDWMRDRLDPDAH